MAEVTKFTGYLASDGSTHTTLKGAIAHTTSLKIAAALRVFAESLDGKFVDSDSGSDDYILVADLPAFLLTNREAILAAFNQTAVLRERKPYKARPKKTMAVSTTSVPTVDSATAGVFA